MYSDRKFVAMFHLEKAWISTGPVTAKNEERCGSALCMWRMSVCDYCLVAVH
jgi:hypothetical protein